MSNPVGVSSLVLRFISGKYQGGEFPLAGKTEVIAGRASDLDIVLVEDMVSRKHARITVQADGLWIEDLGSTNGTFVNGEKIRRSKLREGDRILIGTSILKLDRAGATAAAPKPAGAPEQNKWRLDETPIPDLLQVASNAKKNGVLQIKAAEEGKIFLRNGIPYYASINDNHTLGAAKSIYRIITWTHGQAEMLPADNRKFANEITGDLDEILMEALKIRDELRRLAPKLPPLGRHVVLTAPLNAPLRDLTSEQLDVLQLIYNYGLMKEVLDKSPVSDIDTLKAVGYLLSKGYIREK